MKFDFTDILPAKQDSNEQNQSFKDARVHRYKAIVESMLSDKDLEKTEELAINQNTADNHGST